MKVKFSDKFSQYVKDQNIENLTLVRGNSCGGWAGPTYVPEVRKQAPKPYDIDNFKKFTVEGVNVYVHNRVESSNGTLEFALRGFWFLKDIHVKGFKSLNF